MFSSSLYHESSYHFYIHIYLLAVTPAGITLINLIQKMCHM